jgi:5-methylcytosine-specific restriction endonuclease McrA
VNPKPDDELAHVLDELAAFIVSGEREQADRVARSIAVKPQQVLKRPSPPLRLVAQVFLRDRFTCRYCTARTIAPSVLGVIGSLYPAELPARGKRHKTHEVNWTLYATLDHIRPGSAGGDWLAPCNLVTTCWVCNGRKSNLSLEQLGWTLQSVRTDWDGLRRVPGTFGSGRVAAGGVSPEMGSSVSESARTAPS